MSDESIKHDFEERYRDAASGWSGYHAQAKTDLQFYLGDQWTGKEKAHLKEQEREILTFNNIKRVVNIVSGYERRNRLSLKIGPVGGEDDQACTQHTGVLMHIMNSDAGWPWLCISEAFRMGPLVTGANLINFWPDRKTRQIQFARNPYNKFLLDPQFTKPDLSDCSYILRRELVTKEGAKQLVPASAQQAIEGISSKGTDDKYPDLPRNKLFQEKLYAYDEFWRRVTDKKKLVVFRGGPQQMQMPYDEFVRASRMDKKMLDALLARNPAFTVYEDYVPTVELNILFEEEVVWSGKDPYKVGDYNFVLLVGDFVPEAQEAKDRIQSLVRPARDPQRADNRRLSQMIDLFESCLGAGSDVEEGALIDPEDAYKTGNTPRFFKTDAVKDQRVRERSMPDIPAGMLQLHQIFDRKTFEIPGINEELFGSEDKDIPAVLSKLRQGAALTILQDKFDNLRFAKRQLGRKMVKMVQGNFSPQQVARIINEQPTQDFFTPDFNRYDCVAEEGLLTDTQRQMAYAEAVRLKTEGAPIPWTWILELAPIQFKQRMKQFVAQAEQQQAQMAAQQAKSQQNTEQLKQAKIQADLARSAERRAQVQRDMADAGLSRIRAVKELQGMDQDRFLSVVDRVIAMENLKNKGITRR